jgi:hypothetical protein
MIHCALQESRFVHLTPEQTEAIDKAVESFKGVRPTEHEYDKVWRLLKAIPVDPKPFYKKIPNTKPNPYDKGEVKPLPEFNADRDLPKGWALCNMHDSGFNHGIMNAALLVWTNIWNYWRPL